MPNQEIAQMLYEMSAFLAMAGVAFKSQAYETAARNVVELPRVCPCFLCSRLDNTGGTIP